MTNQEIQSKILQLREFLNSCNYKYYVLSQPDISDYEYDLKMAELQKLEDENPEFADPNSPTQRVGDDTNIEFEQVTHKYPMLSLGNTARQNSAISTHESAALPTNRLSTTAS